MNILFYDKLACWCRLNFRHSLESCLCSSFPEQWLVIEPTVPTVFLGEKCPIMKLLKKD